ncbi:MAG: serine/threonine-protein kinase [Marinicella sp.]
MSDAESFKRVNHWFNQLVDVTEEQRKEQLDHIRENKLLSHNQWQLLIDMLAADYNINDFLPEAVVDVSLEWDSEQAINLIECQPNIGRYKLIELIGSGGMGQVYLAKRNDGSYQQQVAIKISQFHLDADLVKRFENERQILAQLKHAHIAQLLDGGTAKQGQPYLVMEYVDGQSIDKYCIENYLSLKQRLALILQTCDAISYAHQNLILHRDIKPENILVSHTGDVKLLDFGIAKLLSTETDSQIMTQIMTRQYASPEQIKGQMVSTQSDLFSLAVVMYELISGHHPFQAKSQLERDQKVLSGQIKPITQRQSQDALYPELVAVADERLTGDLENICYKALSAEPQNRYISVEAFAQDIKNYLSHRPILARKPSLIYRFGKTIQRHTALVVLSMVTIFTLLGASIYSYRKARMAEAQSHKAQMVAAFMSDLFVNASPATTAEKMSAEDILLQGLNRLDQDKTVDAVIKFELLGTIYRSLWNWGKFNETAGLIDKHHQQCVEELGQSHGLCQDLLVGRAEIYTNREDFAEVQRLLEQAEKISLSKATLDVDELLYIYQKIILMALNQNNNNKAINYSLKAVELKKQHRSNDAQSILKSLNDLANSYTNDSQLIQAKAALDEMPFWQQQIEDSTVRNKAIANYYSNYAFFYEKQKNSIKAFEYRLKTVNWVKQHFAERTKLDLWRMRVLAMAYFQNNMVDKSLQAFSEVEQLYRDQNSEPDADINRIMLEKLMIYLLQEDWENSQNEYQRWQAFMAQSKVENRLPRTTAAVNALYAIHFYNDSTIASSVQKMKSQMSTLTNQQTYYAQYEDIIMAKLAYQQGKKVQAIEMLEHVLTFWEEYPNYHLGLQHLLTQQLVSWRKSLSKK